MSYLLETVSKVKLLADVIENIKNTPFEDFTLVDKRFKGEPVHEWVKEFTSEWFMLSYSEAFGLNCYFYVAARMIDRLNKI